MNTLPDIEQVDFHSAQPIIDYATRLVAAASDHGMFLRHTPRNAATSHIRHTALTWLSRVDTTLPTLPTAQAPLIISCYDLIHRIAHSTPAPQPILII